MASLLRAAAVAAAFVFLLPNPARALERSDCKQYGGTHNCWTPNIKEWKYSVCGEIGAFLSYSIAVCVAYGGTYNAASGYCEGLPPPEARRPTSEGDMQPFAMHIQNTWQGPFCEGPSADPYAWDAVFYSSNCYGQVNGASYTFGYESGNTTTPFAVRGKKFNETGTECSTLENVATYSGHRSRDVECGSAAGQDFAFMWTTGSPALCSVGVYYYPTDPKQDCPSCQQVGNPIDPSSGNKRLVEVDYGGNGPHPLRFERVYNSRVFSMDGKQWRHNYSAHIDNQEFGTVPVAAAHRPSGQTFLFKLTGGVYLPDTDLEDRVTRLVDSGGTLTGWQYYDAANEATELYDATGKLLSITNRAGLTQTLEYSAGATPPAVAPRPGLLIRVTDAFGRQLNFTYDVIGQLATMQDPAGQNYVYESTSQKHFASVTYPDGKKRMYLYNEPGFITINYYEGRLTGIIDENNSRFASYYYDGIGFATRTTHAGGADNYVIGTGNWPASVPITDPLGTVRTYTHSQVNRVWRVSTITQPAASGSGTVTSETTYDGNGNATMRRDFNGNRTNYIYDLTRNLETSRTEGLTATGATTPQTRTISTQWDANFRLPTAIAESLRITTNVYDPDGTLCGARGALCSKTVQATTDVNGSLAFSATPTGSPRVWTYTYNANASVLSMNGPRTDLSDVTSYTYYANNDPELGKRGNVASITNAAGHVTSITAYNAHGQPLMIVDANGLTTTLAYDLRQRLTSRTVGTETTSYEYDSVGQLSKITLPDTSFLTYTYDAAHRLTGMQDSLGNRIAYTLDAMGSRTQEQVYDPSETLKQTRSRVFNNLSRLFRELGAAGQVTEYAYDNQGNVASVKDPLNKVTANAYDALNRLRQVTDPALGVTQYAYNGLDALTGVTDPRSLTTSYTVDGLGNLTLQQSPDTGNTTNTYDAAGNLLTQLDAKGQTTSYAYDALNRVTLITFHDGSKQAYAYDQGANALGRLSSITETDPGNQVTNVIAYAYDTHGRVTSETRTLGSQNYVTAYAYDSSGRLSGVTYPSGRTVTYGFDALGRINQVTTAKNSQSQVVVQNVTYHPFGGVTGFTFGNGQIYSRSVDQDGRIASYSLGSANYDITFDAASRITGITETGNPSNSNTYGYDALDRLTSAVLPTTNFAYSYDAVGNRLTKTIGAATDNYTYDTSSNRIASITPASGPVRSYTLDPNGSTVADGLSTYTYDTRGRMVQAVSPAASTAYQLNALGQRVRKTNIFGDTVFHYDTRGRLIAESDPGGTVKRELIYLGDIPVGAVQ